jgi:hypothetical protein
MLTSKLNKIKKFRWDFWLFGPTLWSVRFPIFLKHLRTEEELYELYKVY